VLPNSSDVENLVRGESGLLSAARQGFIHVDLTSGDPSVTRRIARLYRDQGFAFVDAGMSGMPEVAQAGELTLMVGVEDSAVMERLRPVLGSFARNVMRMGEPGAGHTTKLIIAFMGMAIANASAEILTLARAGGIDIHAIRELIGGTGMDSRTFQAMAMAAIDGDVSRRKLTIGNACKDMSQLVQMLDELGLATTVAPATLQALALASASGHSADYIPSLTRILCKMNGIETC
jgi:3-hydroxyisobutyrate dehydrogenase-like beta-hydroxyacid dehydrogenase